MLKIKRVDMPRNSSSRNDMFNLIFKYICKLVFIFVVISAFMLEASAKNTCKPQLKKLQQIQAKQREGHSLSRGKTLRAQENVARELWWQCSRGIKKNTVKSSSKQADKKSKIGVLKVIKENKRGGGLKDKRISIAKNQKTPRYQNQKIIIKQKYKGRKKYEWLAFYQQPSKCKHPKNLHVFAFCAEDKLTQQKQFERTYVK